MGGQVEKSRMGLRARAKASFSEFLHNGKHSKREAGENGSETGGSGSESGNFSDKFEALGLSSSAAAAAPGEKREPSPRWPEEFGCPISSQLMADPVIAASGATYERRNVEAYLDMGNMACVKTGETWEHHGLVRNMALKNLIENWCDANDVPRPKPPDAPAARTNALRACGAGTESDANGGTSSSSEQRSGFESGSVSGSVNGSLRGESPPLAALKGNHTGGSRRGSRHGSGKPRSSQIPESESVSGSVNDQFFQNKPPHEKLHYREHHTWSSGSDGSKAQGGGGLHAKEWPPAPSGLSHSSSVSSPSTRARQVSGSAVPLPLATKPSAFSKASGSSRQGSGGLLSSDYVGELTEDKIDELVKRLQQVEQPVEQEQAVVEIRRLSRVSAENRLALCNLVLEDVMPLVESPYTSVQVNAVASVMNMSLEKDNKLKVARAGGIPRLIFVLQSGHSEAQELAAGALFSLALNDENKMAIGALGGIPPLLYVLQRGQRGARRDAAMALYHLSFSQLNRNKIAKAGGVEVFLDIAKDERSDVVSGVLMILSNIAASKDGKEALAKMKGVQVMVSLLTRGDDVVGAASSSSVASSSSATSSSSAESPTSADSSRGVKEDAKVNWAEVREHAAATLLQLSHHSFRFKSLALEAGALEGLQRLLEEGTPRAREKASTLLAILRDPPNADGHFDDNSPLYRRAHRPLGTVGDPNKSDSAQF